MKIYRNQVTLAGETESNMHMLIHMLTGYQPEDLFLPRQTTYSAYGVILHLTIRQKVQSDIMTNGERTKALYYLPPVRLTFKKPGFWTLILHFSQLKGM